MTLNELVKAAHENAKARGFWDGENHNIGEKLALIHSEVSEALEELRVGSTPTAIHELKEGKIVGFPVELADVVIRVADLCGHLGIDLENAVDWKMKVNRGRPHKHGKAF